MSEIDEIFLIDDDDVDVMAIRRALLRISNPPKLIVANDGEEALNILSEGRLSLSAVIVLDINMPRISGFELLKKLRCNDELRSYRDLPVWVMTTSEADRDLERADEYGVAGYIRKTFQSSDVNMILHRVLGEGSAGAG
ncbi:response regulator [Thalassolituus sp.]|uniref:response regulator n=1 Tax=Thalassolituus sp. TaxID=2030822 RepID=UPI00116CA491|nr:response regulator [Thalassolituus sp.]MEC8909111.1 response regulator [Pseudomonadota bacterium]MEC9409833.1 response regulator [Pseudomonadota bacterium]TPD55961.1 MAG: response regulator [Thalassolituus maritimus]